MPVQLLADPAVGPCIFGPGLVAGFAGMGDGMEAPAQLAGVHIVGTNIAAQRWLGLRQRGSRR